MIKLPKNQKEHIESIKTDFQRENTSANALTKNNWVGSMLTGLGLRNWDFIYQLKFLQKELFLPTAVRTLPIFGVWYGLPRNQATQSVGNIVAVGTLASTVPISTQLQNSAGAKYQTTAPGTIVANSLSVSTMTRSGSTVTVTTAVDHELSSQTDVDISGAVETDYNGTHSINVTDSNIFTFTISATPSTPATGTILADQDSILIPVESINNGNVLNLTAGDALTLSVPISGVNSTLRVDYAGLTGGADAESNDDYRDRLLDRARNPVAHFNAADIINQAKKVPGVTRGWVKEYDPAPGSLKFYFVRDNDASIIPGAGAITTTKNKILEIKPATVADSAVDVLAPTAVTVNFAFTSITPDTTEMRLAIEAAINSDSRKLNEGEDWREDAYRAAITTVVDRSTNAPLTNYTLTLTGDQTVNSGEIAVVGTVTF